MKHFFWGPLLLAAVFMLSACSMMPTIPPNPSNPIKTVAVLPLANETNDVEAPQIVRKKMIEAVDNRHYAVMPIEQVDQRLRDNLGITLGGQLPEASLEQLRNVLEVDGLIYGTLMDFKETTTGIYNVKKVRGKFKLVNALNQSTVWENGIGVKSEMTMGGDAGAIADIAADLSDKNEEVPWITIDSQSSNQDFGTTLGVALAAKLISKATNTQLARETNEMIRRVLEDFPAGPGASVSFTVPDLPAINPGMMMPTIGHLDLGDRDFSAVMIHTWKDEKQQESRSWKTPLAKRSQALRLEMDYNQMMGDEAGDVEFEKTIMLYRGDQQTACSLYPDRKEYVEFEESDDHVFSEPEVKLTRVGTETIEGHPTIKYSLEMRLEDGTSSSGYLWNATDLDNMTIKTYLEYDGAESTMLLTNIKLGSPPASLFEIPADFTQADSRTTGLIIKQ